MGFPKLTRDSYNQWQCLKILRNWEIIKSLKIAGGGGVKTYAKVDVKGSDFDQICLIFFHLEEIL